MLNRIIAFWNRNNNSNLLKWLVGAFTISLIFVLAKLIGLMFGGNVNTSVYVLPGFIKYFLILLLLVGGIATGEKNNSASIILASATAGVLFFFFTPMLTRWLGNIIGIVPTPLVAGIFLVGLGVLAKKVLNLSKLALILFIGGAIFIVLAFAPIILPGTLITSLISISSDLPTKKIHGFLVGLEIVKAILIGACLLFWIKKPSSVFRFFVSGLLIVGIYYFTDTTVGSFLLKHPTIEKTVETQKGVGQNKLERFIAELIAGDSRRDVLSHKKIAKTGIFYISRETTLCEDIVDGACQQSNSTPLVGDEKFIKVFILKGKAKAIDNYSWEKIYLFKPGGRQVYVFAGDLIEESHKAEAEVASKIKEEVQLKTNGWREPSAVTIFQDVDINGEIQDIVCIIFPKDVQPRDSVIFHKFRYTKLFIKHHMGRMEDWHTYVSPQEKYSLGETRTGYFLANGKVPKKILYKKI